MFIKSVKSSPLLWKHGTVTDLTGPVTLFSGTKTLNNFITPTLFHWAHVKTEYRWPLICILGPKSNRLTHNVKSSNAYTAKIYIKLWQLSTNNSTDNIHSLIFKKVNLKKKSYYQVLKQTIMLPSNSDSCLHNFNNDIVIYAITEYQLASTFQTVSACH